MRSGQILLSGTDRLWENSHKGECDRYIRFIFAERHQIKQFLATQQNKTEQMQHLARNLRNDTRNISNGTFCKRVRTCFVLFCNSIVVAAGRG